MQNNFFSIPIWNYTLNFNYDSVIEKCYNIKNTYTGRKLTNVGGWQSDDIKLEVFEEVYSLVKDKLNEVANNIHPNVSFNIDNAWVNINSGLQYNTSHEHPLSAFSGVLYLKCNEYSGNIKFESPSLMRHYPFNPHDSKLFQTYTEYQPKVGDLLIFPSWLSHSVLPSKDSADRISIAFNTTQI